MQNTTFLEYLDYKKRRKPHSESVVIFGGFIPHQGKRPLREAEEEQDQAPSGISKAPILFDKADVDYLVQFPPQYWGQALAWRYGHGIRQYKESSSNSPEESRKDSNWQYVPITGHGARGTMYFLVNTGIRQLVKKLEKPIDYDKLGKSKGEPEEKDAYQGGYNNYDFNDFMSNPKNPNQIFSNGYIGLTKEVATDLLSNWRSGMVDGWLIPKGHDISKVKYGGIRAGTKVRAVSDKDKIGGNLGEVIQREYVMAYDGTPIKNSSPDQIIQPVMDDAALLAIQHATDGASIVNVNKRGECKWKYYTAAESGKFVPAGETGYSHVPLMFPGSFVDSQGVEAYQQRLKAIQPLLKKAAEIHQKPEEEWTPQERAVMEKYNGQHKEISAHQQGVPRYDMYDWAHRQFTYMQDADGNYYSRLGVQTRTKGGFHPNKQQKGKVPGDWSEMENLMIGNWAGLKTLNRNDDFGAFTVKTPWGEQKPAPVVKGVSKKIGKFLGTPEYTPLAGMKGDICQDASILMRNLAGEPVFVKLTQLVQQGRANPGVWDDQNNQNIYKRAYDKISGMSGMYAWEVWQLPLPGGIASRRLRYKQGHITMSRDSENPETGKSAGDTYDSQAVNVADRRGLAADKRGRGERSELRGGSGISGDEGGGYEVTRGHSLESIRTFLKSDLAAMQAADRKREQIKAGTYIPSEDEVKANFRKSFESHYDIFDKLIQMALRDGHAKTELDAMKWADSMMDRVLNGEDTPQAQPSSYPIDPQAKDLAAAKVNQNNMQILGDAAIEALKAWEDDITRNYGDDNWEKLGINTEAWENVVKQITNPKFKELPNSKEKIDDIEKKIHQRFITADIRDKFLRLTSAIRKSIESDHLALAAKNTSGIIGAPVSQRPAVQQLQQQPQKNPLGSTMAKYRAKQQQNPPGNTQQEMF